jgi:Flp pilus assembly protein TadD
MSFFYPRTHLTTEERAARRSLLFSDALSLTALFIITLLLAFITNAFYQSYASHQAELSRRWFARGEDSLRRNQPVAAVNALRSALALTPGQRKIEIALAEALAAAGRTQEATAYFTTLAESEPGDGMIQLELARLARRQGNTQQALESYHRAIYGDWQGDGAVRRREARLEMVNFLIENGLDNQARDELLVAAGNAPEEDIPVQLNIAGSLEKARAPVDALGIYKSVLEHHPALWQALAGAGRTAFAAGRYAEATRYLARAAEAPEGALPPETEAQTKAMLEQSKRLLLLYPSPQLNPHDRGIRILADRKIAQARLASCLATPAPSSSAPSPAAASPSPLRHNPLQSLARRFEHHPVQPANGVALPPSPEDALESVTARWKQLPQQVTLRDLENDPDLASTEIQLIYDTEQATAEVCGAPTTQDDNLLLKIAQAPNAVGQE